MAFYNKSTPSPMLNRGKPGYGDVPQSKYNSAALKLLRLNESWQTCRRHWRKGEFEKLNEELKLIWLELATDARDDDVKEIKEMRVAYAELIRQKRSRARDKAIFDLLERKWELLFEVEKAQGLGKSYVDPTEDEW